jgi:hypothetical protein
MFVEIFFQTLAVIIGIVAVGQIWSSLARREKK